MKLHLVPALTGITWVKLGVKTFFRQPLALSGLFFMFMAVVSVVSLVPVIGSAISLLLVPAATLGLMAASREAHEGRFPMPTTLITAFRSGPVRAQHTLVLGAMYAGALMLVLGAAALLGGAGGGAEVALNEAEVTPEMVRSTLFSGGLWLAMVVYVPVMMAFWHAPALVHWHGVSPVKSLFFSAAACWANKGAMLVYGLSWVGVFMLMGLAISLLGAMLGGTQAMSIILYPSVLFMASMFHASIYFTFRDSFLADDDDEALAPPTPPTGDDA